MKYESFTRIGKHIITLNFTFLILKEKYLEVIHDRISILLTYILHTVEVLLSSIGRA